MIQNRSLRSSKVMLVLGISAALFAGCRKDMQTQPVDASANEDVIGTMAVGDKTTAFTEIAYSNADLINPGRGAEHWNNAAWNDQYAVRVPAGNSNGLDVYYRFNWFDIEGSTKGSYNWSIFDQQLNTAISQGKKFSFGVMSVCAGCSPTVSGAQMGYPNYVHTAMQSESVKDWKYDGIWVPNWNSESYLKAWEALLTAIANHINTGSYKGKAYKDAINYIDVRGYGNWGEWHTYPWYTNTPTNEKPTVTTLKRIIDSHIKAFPNYPLAILFGAYDGGNASKIPAEVSYYALTAKNAWGDIGWRRDNWGDAGYDGALANNPGSYNGVRFKDLIVNKYKTAIVVGEPANDQAAISRNCGSMHCDLEREIRLYHATSFGNGNYPNLSSQTTRNNVLAASKASGYRLKINNVTAPTTITRNQAFAISTAWQNVGIAPTYENWDVLFELQDASNVVKYSGKSSKVLKLFLPATSSTTTTDNLTVPSTVAAGSYKLVVRVHDPKGYRPDIKLAISGRNTDGSYTIGTVTVK